MNVLIVAPTMPDLPWQADEVGQLASMLDATVLQGTVTERDIWMAIKASGTFTGMWFSTHASTDGILLSDEQIGIDAVANYLCVAQCEWCVFNTCDGYEFVDTLQRYYPVDLVAASVASLADTVAWRFSVLLGKRLAETGDIREAIRLTAAGGASPYRFWPNPESVVVKEREQGGQQQVDQQVVLYELRTELRFIREQNTRMDEQLQLIRGYLLMTAGAIIVLLMAGIIAYYGINSDIADMQHQVDTTEHRGGN